MKKLLAVLALMLSFTAAAQTPPVVFKNSGRLIAWDYPTALMKSASIVRFELSYDGITSFASVGIPTPFTDGTTLPNNDSYSATIPNTLALGNHTIQAKACTAVFCSDPSPPFTFVFDALAAPGDVRVK